MIARWFFRAMAPLWLLLLDVWFRTLRIETINQTDCQDENHILAFWHSQLFVPVFLHRHSGINALVSPSEDGNVLKRVLHRLGYSVVEGSSSRGGYEALLRLVRSGQSRIMMTPDGPKGPSEKAKTGVVFLAASLNIPIVPVVVRCASSFRLSSWDRMEIPMPFSRCRVKYLEPWNPGKDNRDVQAFKLQNMLNGSTASYELFESGSV